jgi:hypothetical protein
MKERATKKGKKGRGKKKLQKDEMAWLTTNTRFPKESISAWHKVRNPVN